MKKDKQKVEKWAEFYDRGSILDQIMEEPVEFNIDRRLQKDILTKKRKRKLQNVTLKMDPLQIVTIRKLATMKSIPYQTLIRHWLSDKIKKELSLS
jgi:predicted DNA binding CopG/RHH family protein